MKNTKASRIVTAVIVLLALIFAALIVRTYIERKKTGTPAAPPAPAGGGVPGGANAQGAQTGRAPSAEGNQRQSGQGNAQTGRAPSAEGNQRQSGQGNAQTGRAPSAEGNQRQSGQGNAQTGQGPGGGEGRARQQERNATVVRAVPVALGTIENNVVINGDVLARTQVALYPTVAGRLVETRFRVGDTVRQGETVAMVDPSRPGEVYSRSPVVSTITGTVLQTPVSPGDTLNVQSAVYVVGDLSALAVETFVPERFTTAVRLGLSAQVSFEAMSGETFRARIDEVSPALDPSSRTQRIRLRFDPPSGRLDPRIRAGMFATVSLVTNSRSNVPVIPRVSVINTYGSWIVFTVNADNIAKRRVIRLGLESDDFVEVAEGLELGELVVTAGQNFLSDDEPVRITG